MSQLRRTVALSLILVALVSSAVLAADRAPGLDAGVLSGLGIRNIGSATMSGRIDAVTAAHTKKGDTVLYIGSASGGVWKSTDGGTTFTPKFDRETVQSIGAIALDPSDPDVVWVGTGEAWTRNTVSIGDGIYRSGDGGETWTNMGLPESERIVKIAVSPADGNVVFACVTGKLWSDSADRGVYRTGDGGKSWSLVLEGSNPSTGCGSMSMDAKNPNTLYASLWDFRRKGWTSLVRDEWMIFDADEEEIGVPGLGHERLNGPSCDLLGRRPPTPDRVEIDRIPVKSGDHAQRGPQTPSEPLGCSQRELGRDGSVEADDDRTGKCVGLV